MRAISGFADLLRDKLPSGDREASDFVTRITKGAATLDDQVKDLLAFGAISHSEALPERITLLPIFEAAVGDLKDEIDGRNASIRLAENLASIWADRSLMRQAARELLCNAIKFVPEDRTPEIAIDAQAVNG